MAAAATRRRLALRLWRSPPVRAWLVSRGLVLLLAYAGLVLAPYVPDGDEIQAFPRNRLLDGFTRGDAGWYWNVAENGYRYRPGERSNTNFFPLYPLLSLAFAQPFRLLYDEPGQAFFAGAILLSHLSLLFGLVAVHRLGRDALGPAAASRAVWLEALFPFSFFFSAAYTEALFLALSAWAFLLGRRGRWLPACLLAALAGITRVPGFLVAVGLFVLYWEQRGFRLRRVRPDVLAFLVTPLGHAALFWHYGRLTGDPFVFVRAQREGWGRGRSISIAARFGRAVAEAWVHPSWEVKLVYGWHLLVGPLAILVLPGIFIALGAGLGSYTLLTLLLVFSTGVGSNGRYAAALFPLFLGGARLLRRPVPYGYLLGLFTAFLALFLFYFTHAVVVV